MAQQPFNVSCRQCSAAVHCPPYYRISYTCSASVPMSYGIRCCCITNGVTFAKYKEIEFGCVIV